jgi:hypothetical protein
VLSVLLVLIMGNNGFIAVNSWTLYLRLRNGYISTLGTQWVK